MGSTMVVSPEREQLAVDTLASLDWVSDENVGIKSVAHALVINEDAAELILDDLRVREIVRVKAPRNSVNEPGYPQNSGMMWERTGVPTTLEIVRVLTALQAGVSLDQSMHALCTAFPDWNINIQNKAILGDLRDKGILKHEGASSGETIWVRCSGS